MAAILIVDDDAHVRNLISETLSREGFAVECARSGDEAYRMLRREGGWDLVISDLHMPGGMDGHELLYRVQKSIPDLPVILLSGDPRAASLACFAALAKPVNLDVLLDTVDAALVHRLAHAWSQT